MKDHLRTKSAKQRFLKDFFSTILHQKQTRYDFYLLVVQSWMDGTKLPNATTGHYIYNYKTNLYAEFKKGNVSQKPPFPILKVPIVINAA
jgi:hypothetical protein